MLYDLFFTSFSDSFKILGEVWNIMFAFLDPFFLLRPSREPGGTMDITEWILFQHLDFYLDMAGNVCST